MPKKILLLLMVLTALAASLTPLSAAAEENELYARVTQAGVYLYAEPDGDSGLFELPQSWFVRVTGETGAYTSVAYLEGTAAAVYGYCKTEELTFVDYIPETPYLSYTVEVTFTAGDDSLPDGFITSYRVDAAFCGTFSYGSATYCYVYLDGAFGYVPASACSSLDYPLNTEHTESGAASASGEAAEKSGGSAVNIVLVCALAAAALGIAFFLFRPAARRKKREEPREDVYF